MKKDKYFLVDRNVSVIYDKENRNVSVLKG